MYLTDGVLVCSQDDVSGRNGGNSSKGGAAFAPRFDGLRFIETLITGHR